MQDYERKAVLEVVEEINKKFFLPDIQRNFVWKSEQVYTLFDSIMRNYPISTFLFWRQSGEFLKKEKIKKLEFVKNSKEQNKENTETTTVKEYFLVLDGQQRLTTFYLVLKGNYIIRNNPNDLFFNILSGEIEQEDGILYEFKFFNKNKGINFIENNDEIKLWHNVKHIYNITQIYSGLTALSKEIKDKYAIDLTDKQKDNIERLHRNLKTEKIIYFYPEVEPSYNKVLDIFVRTNSGGTMLSYSDLLFSTIKSKWTEARDKFNILLSNINDNDRYKFSNDFVLKSALVMYAKNSEEVRYRTNNFKSSLIKNLKGDWKYIERAITLCVDLLQDKMFLTSYKTISSNNAIIPIIYWIFKKGRKGFGYAANCISDIEITLMRLWLTKALLSGIFGGQADTILFKCKEIIDNKKSKLFPSEELEIKINSETKKNMKLSPDFLDKVKYGSSDSYLVLSICYGGAINFKPRMKGNLPEQDHIFSQYELRKAKIPENKINSIFNIRYIGSSENKIKTKTSFTEWIESISEKERKKHLIPKGDWTIKNYDDFLRARKKLIRSNFKYE